MGSGHCNLWLSTLGKTLGYYSLADEIPERYLFTGHRRKSLYCFSYIVFLPFMTLFVLQKKNALHRPLNGIIPSLYIGVLRKLELLMGAVIRDGTALSAEDSFLLFL